MAIRINKEYVNPFIDVDIYQGNRANAMKALDALKQGDGKGNDFLGWIDLPQSILSQIKEIQSVARDIQMKADVFIIVGIGGSYLGSKAVINALTSSFYNMVAESRGMPQIHFTGTNLSGAEMQELLALIKEKDVCINVISKSGTTTEPALAFRILMEAMESKYSKEELRYRVFATTDAQRGALKVLADANGWTTFTIPDDVGGRFSVLTPVGLLPIAVAGIDIDMLVKGATDAMQEGLHSHIDNIAVEYATLRNALYQDGKMIEILANYEPKLNFIAEWWKQLYGESEGKEEVGIFPASVSFTADLHSMGQYIQEGPRHLFETVLHIMECPDDVLIPKTKENLDNLNYLAGKGLNHVNKMAMLGTVEAHVEGGVPNIIVEIDQLDAYHIGNLLYFFELACGISAYMLDVNPFDQPGVESYKRNMFRLLGKP